MIELLVAYVFCIIDYAYLLYFYYQLIHEELNVKKAIPVILSVAALQCLKDAFIDLGPVHVVFDHLFVCLYLFLYSRKFDMHHFLCVLLIDCVYSASLTVFTAVVKEFWLDFDLVLIFGVESILFIMARKVFVIAVFVIFTNWLRNKDFLLGLKVDKLMLVILILITASYSYTFSNVYIKNSILFYTLLLTVILISIFYLLYRYCLLFRELEEKKVIEYSKSITSTYVMQLEEEHEKIKMIRHDMKNQLGSVHMVLEKENYQDAKHLLETMITTLDTTKVSLSNNIYVDAILRQKMNEYANIHFDLKVHLSDGFNINGNDVISLISNIIDNACEELERIHKDAFHMTI